MPESSLLTLLLVVVLVLLGVLTLAVLLIWRRLGRTAPSDSMQLLSQQMLGATQHQDQRLAHLNEQLTQTLSNLNTHINQRLDATGKTIGDVKGQLGELGQAARQILQVGTDVRKLQDILQSPKLRGGLGEWSLENLLAEVLPRAHYELQHRFQSGATVDGWVILAQGGVAIDAKFPLPNFQAMLETDSEEERGKLRKTFLRDVRRRVDEIAEKYILPDEGTLDFALMYVPAENVYYELLLSVGTDLDACAYARAKKVVPVSPNTLYAYLMVVAAGLRGLQIEKNAQDIRRQLTRLGGDLEGVQADFALVGKHLNNALAKHTDTARRLDNLAAKLGQMHEETDSPTS